MSDKEIKVNAKRKVRKAKFVIRFKEYLEKYHSALIIQVDNVGSHQMQKTRMALRGKAVVLLGKNTLMRKVMKEVAATRPELENLTQFVYGNMGLVFTNGDLSEIRSIILTNKVPAAARPGTKAPADVFIPAGPTGMDPGQTSFFQALNIGTKIVKGAIEIINQVHLIKVGDKVNQSHVALLSKLNILPFFYGFKVTDVYENGTAYSAAILDLSKEELMNKFHGAVRRFAAISVGAHYPTTASLPYYVSGGFSKVLSLALGTGYPLKEAEEMKTRAAAGPTASSSSPAAAGGKPAAAAAKVVEKPKSEESEQDLGFSLFD